MDLVTKRKKPHLDLCIICQKDIRTRSRIVEASRQLKEDLLEDIPDEDIDCIR